VSFTFLLLIRQPSLTFLWTAKISSWDCPTVLCANCWVGWWIGLKTQGVSVGPACCYQKSQLVLGLGCETAHTHWRRHGGVFYGGVDPQLSPWPLMWCGTKPRRKCALAHRDVIIVVSESLGLGRQLSFTSLGSRPGGVIQILQLGLLHVHNMIQYELKSKLRTTGATP